MKPFEPTQPNRSNIADKGKAGADLKKPNAVPAKDANIKDKNLGNKGTSGKF